MLPRWFVCYLMFNQPRNAAASFRNKFYCHWSILQLTTASLNELQSTCQAFSLNDGHPFLHLHQIMMLHSGPTAVNSKCATTHERADWVIEILGEGEENKQAEDWSHNLSATQPLDCSPSFTSISISTNHKFIFIFEWCEVTSSADLSFQPAISSKLPSRI